MNKMSQISVVMSVYHRDNPIFFERALKSVWVDQTLKPIEIVLVQDGPIPEDLKDIITRWKSKLEDKLKIIEHSENKGLTRSLNDAIGTARGEFLARMDSDDLSERNRFKVQSEYLVNNPDLDVIGGAIEEMDDDENSIGIRKYPSTHEEVMKYIYKGSPLAHPAVMMRRRIFDEGNRYNESYRTSQDLALWFDLLSKGYKIGNVSNVVLRFRRGNDVYERRGKQKAKNELKIYLKGIKSLYGVITPKYFYPLIRYFVRRLPKGLIKFAYNSKLRKKLLNK